MFKGKELSSMHKTGYDKPFIASEVTSGHKTQATKFYTKSTFYKPITAITDSHNAININVPTV